MSSPCVAYVLKGYPRVSELFIASEIWRLEQLGTPIRLYVLKPSDEDVHHRVVDDIEARPVYLPATTSLSNRRLVAWLRSNLRPFLAPLVRVAVRHPLRMIRTTTMAATQAVRAREGRRPRKIYVKEFLQAVALADQLDQVGDVTHLHAHFAHGTTTVTWLAGQLTGVGFSFTGHAKDIYRASLNPAGLLVRKMRAARFVVTCTGANHDHLHALAPEVPIHRIYHGLNAEFSQLITGMEPAERPAVAQIVSVGRLVSKKGFDVLVEAVARLHASGIEARLVIAGEHGDDEEHIRALVEHHRLTDAVEFLGIVNQQQLFDLYRSSTVFALACRVDDSGDRDGIPNVLMEAMAAGLPVVSTAISGIPELIDDGTNGLLVAPEDPDALADALLRVIKDPRLAADLGLAGRTTIAQRFDGRRLAMQLTELFATATSYRDGGGR